MATFGIGEQKMDFIMGTRVNIFIFIIFSLFCFNLFSISKDPPIYLKYVNEITKSFTNEIEKEFDLTCIGSGGTMPHNVEKIDLAFVAYRKGTIKEARQLEVIGIERLLKKINEHEKIRPYLSEYPFKYNGVHISISFWGNEGNYCTDGSIVHVSLAHNKIYYDGAELKKKTIPPIIHGTTGEVVRPSEEIEVNEFMTLLEESYEDAVKIVKKNP